MHVSLDSLIKVKGGRKKMPYNPLGSSERGVKAEVDYIGEAYQEI